MGLLAIIGVSVYCIYSAWNSGSKTLEKDASGNVKGNSKTFKTFKTWKSREFDNIPAAVMEAAKNIPVAEHHLEFTPRNGEKVRIRQCYRFAILSLPRVFFANVLTANQEVQSCGKHTGRCFSVDHHGSCHQCIVPLLVSCLSCVPGPLTNMKC